MQERSKTIKTYIITGIYLAICTYTDIKYKKISVFISAAIGLAGLFISLCSLWDISFLQLDILGFRLNLSSFSGHISLFTIAASLSVCILMLTVSILTKGSFGTGDCIMLTVLACFMAPAHLITVLIYGLFFSGITALLLLIVKKRSRKDTVFFAPFLLTGHICCFLLYSL